MKVVIFCGGLGTRISPYSETVPKPMVQIGQRPILWHIMKYYAYFGHKDFILALGYKSEIIKNYFLNYREEDSNDFVYKNGGKNIMLLNSDISDWNISFIDTGIHSNIGMRLLKVKHLLKGESMFLANYADGLSDINLSSMIDEFQSQNNILASFIKAKPKLSMHFVEENGANLVKSIQPFTSANLWINAGFFIFRNEIFNYIKEGEELVEEPFERLIKENKLYCFKHTGFWQAMDTFKDKMVLDDMLRKENGPWELWKQ